MNAIERFRKIASEERFKGWPLVGEYKPGEKVPFFGQVLRYKLQTGNGAEDYVSLLRHFGWVVVFGVTMDNQVVTLVQWKPGTNKAGWELPPGGIGRVKSDITKEELLSRAQEFYLKETGYGGGEWTYLGNVLIETGKFRGATPDDHGLPAHMYLAVNLEPKQEARKPNPNEIMETLLVPLSEFGYVIHSGLFHECSALPCALLALGELQRIGKIEAEVLPRGPEAQAAIGFLRHHVRPYLESQPITEKSGPESRTRKIFSILKSGGAWGNDEELIAVARKLQGEIWYDICTTP